MPSAPVDQTELITTIHERLAKIEPLEVRIVDQSRRHRGHKEAAGGAHLEILVIAPSFAGQTSLMRQRRIIAELGDLMNGPIHGLTLRAATPNEL